MGTKISEEADGKSSGIYETLLKDALAYTAHILETQHEPFLVLDSTLGVLNANPPFCAQFAVTKEETEGKLLYELGNGQWDIPRLRELFSQVISRNVRFDNFKMTHTFEAIGERTMLVNARRVPGVGTEPEKILVAFQDITERLSAEQRLKDSEMRYRRLFESAKDGILILDADTGKILEANAFMGEMVGLERGEIVGKELYEIGMYADREENRSAFCKLQEKKYIRHEHLPVRHRDGHKVEVEFIANVYSEDHTLIAQCNVRDISERVAMERMITEQTATLEEVSRHKDEFLATLSHELRNPLNPIRAALHLLSVSDPDIQRKSREIIERQVGNLTKIVTDLLEVSRFTSGRVRLELRAEDLNQLIAHAVETVDPLIRQRKHTLRVHSCMYPVWINCDALRIEEVLVNVLANAAKYTDQNGIIELWCEHSVGQNVAQVRVRDNGMGIEKDMLPRIFDLFSQADRTLARSAGGIGIGLSLAHRLVKLHGGSIEATSPPEGQTQGSEFIVQLPITVAPEHAEPASGSSDGLPHIGSKVLVVDDSVDSVFLIDRIVQDLGHSTQSAYTGPDGLKIAEEWRPDVVLLDIGLPGLDGYEVARQLRRIPELEKTWIVAVTGYGRDTDIALAREAGIDAHLLKPIEPADIEKVISQSYKR